MLPPGVNRQQVRTGSNFAGILFRTIGILFYLYPDPLRVPSLSMRSGSTQTRGPRVWGSGSRVLVPMARPKAQDNPPKRFQRVKSHLENDIAGLGPPGTWCIAGGERPTQIDRHRSRSGRISAKIGCGSRVMMCAHRLVRFIEKTDRSPPDKF